MEPARTEANAIPDNAECKIIQNNTVLGGDKPLHRFIKGQPKIIGIVLLILGSSFFILSIPLKDIPMYGMGVYLQPGFWLGPMFILCGILYILTEYNPTKKTVTASFAISIAALLTALWVAFFEFLPIAANFLHHEQKHMVLVAVLHLVIEVYILVGMAIFITMSALAGKALRSSHSQTQVVMTQGQTSTE